MKIVVLAGGISSERSVSLVTGSSVCRALRENGHRAILVDMFLGMEEVPADMESLFDAPDGLCPDAKIEVTAPDLDAVRSQRKDKSDCRFGPHVLELCAMSPRLAPVVDFGHLNARVMGEGGYKTRDDYMRTFDAIACALGDHVAMNLHSHFSKIEYTAAGERRHLTFEDTVYGPDFEPLMEAVAELGVTPTLICESAGTQAEDALAMKRHYLSLTEGV